MVQAIQAGPLAHGIEHDIQTIWNLLRDLRGLTTYVAFQHVYSHCGITRNERVDRAADAGAKDTAPAVMAADEDGRFYVTFGEADTTEGKTSTAEMGGWESWATASPTFVRLEQGG
jgi:hypothetical protein